MIGEIRNAHGERIDSTFTPGAEGRQDLVIVAHGVTSHKERPWLVGLCDRLAREGIASLRISYSGNGESDGRYEEATITKEVADLGCVIDHLEERNWRLAYAGHSMGGAVGTLRAAKDARLIAFLSLAGMVHVARFMERLFGHLEPGKDVMLGKEHCPLSQGFLDDARAVGDVLDAARSLRLPHLIIHGTEDEIVPYQDALDFCAVTDGRTELVTLEGIDHRFTGAVEKMAEAGATWLARQFLA